MKGISKRVVVVKSPDPKIFEQAIFIVREDVLSGRPDGDADILRQAQKVANEYIKNSVMCRESLLRRIPPAAFALIGALASAGVCAAAFLWIF